jgi:hypothetical protein
MGSLPVATTCYGLIYGGKLSGVAVVGSACSPTVGASIGIKNEGICELRRFALRDNMPKNTASYFLSRVIKKIAGYNVLISYADSQAGHIGSIYQACNAIYLGCSQENRIVMPSGEIIKDNRYLFHQIKNNAQSLSGAKF